MGPSCVSCLVYYIVSSVSMSRRASLFCMLSVCESACPIFSILFPFPLGNRGADEEDNAVTEKSKEKRKYGKSGK